MRLNNGNFKDSNFYFLLSLFDQWIEGDDKGEFKEPNIFGYYDLITERDGFRCVVKVCMLERHVSIFIGKGKNQIFYLGWFDCNYIDIVDEKNKVIEFGLAHWGKPLMRCVLSLTGSPVVKIDKQFYVSTDENYISIRKI